MTKFRPCIDLHRGKVKQIVGGSLNEQGAATNYVSPYDAAYYAELYCQYQLEGGHLISLGAGNQEQVLQALAAWPDALQYGGGVSLENAEDYLVAGAEKLIVTSYLFVDGEFSLDRLMALKAEAGKERLVLDLSCRRVEQSWYIATNGWQSISGTEVNAETLAMLSEHCSEFLIHAADVEGLQEGIDENLVEFLGSEASIPITYAGGARNLDDLALVEQLSFGKLDLTIGSALDVFGGEGVRLVDCVAWNNR